MSNSNDIGYIFAFLISGNNLKQTELNSLEQLKYKAVKYNTSRQQLFKELGYENTKNNSAQLC